jgi:hypothetical protein
MIEVNEIPQENSVKQKDMGCGQMGEIIEGGPLGAIVMRLYDGRLVSMGGRHTRGDAWHTEAGVTVRVYTDKTTVTLTQGGN